MTSTAALVMDSGSVIIGWLIVVERLTTASTAVVSSRAYGSAARMRCCALTIRDDAISSWARVILAIDLTALIRARTARSWAPMAPPTPLRPGPGPGLVPGDGLLLVPRLAERGDGLVAGYEQLAAGHLERPAEPVGRLLERA